MSKITHPGTGFTVGDPDITPLSAARLPSPQEVEAAAGGLILSASGWRKVFAPGGEESDESGVSSADLVLCGAAALVFAELARSRAGSGSPGIVLGIDSRPTGPTMADAMIRVFLGLGLQVRYLFIVAAPEIMAYARAAREAGEAAGFCYVSASHNPRGHNGIKFGLGGGVLGASESAALIERYRSLLADASAARRVFEAMSAADPREVAAAFASCSRWKRRSVSAYTLFAREVVSGTSDPAEQELLFDAMAEAAAARPVGVLAELNGSARCLSIDRDFLEGLGVRWRSVNDRARQFAHRIVPEGESLTDAMRELETAAAEESAFVAAYVPDCDGDRGNLVVMAGDGRARPVEAQEVFALACVAELAQLVRDGKLSYDAHGNAREKVALVVNDATSMRINAVARAFDVDVYRSETGEANVVGLAAAMREKGYIVRILGEGSNGGNITHPSAVRDPLATLVALLKLLLVRGERGRAGLFEIWARRSGARFRPDFGISEVLASLPAFATTSVFEDRAALKVRSADHAALKARYATIFEREWEARKAELQRRLGVVSWEAFATNGQAERRVGADFAASGRGGLRVSLADASGRPLAFVWMRGSGTESVFRVMADAEGGRPEDEEYLLAWHTAMVREADAG
jgi:phosphoglucomutase